MSKALPEVPLADIAEPILRSVEVVPGQRYRTIGVKWWGGGAYERQTIDGSGTAAKTLSLVREGDLIINKIWVRHGSTAIAGADVGGCAASGEFPTFTLDESRVEPRWLHWQTKTRGFWAKCDALSQGTSGKNRIKPELFLTIRVPLPPLAEQRRVVARIEELAARIHEARTLRHQAGEEAEALPLAARHRLFENELSDAPAESLESLVTVVRGSSPRPKGDLRYYGGPVPRLLIADITRDGKFVTPRIDSLTEEGAKLSRPMPHGSLVLAISGSYGLPAFLAVDACIHDGFIGFRDVSQRVAAEYLYQVMLWRKPYFDSVVKNSGLQNLTTTHLKHMSVPVPPLPDQRRIVAELDALQAQVDALKRLQAETATELDALLPAILDRAFKGEL